MRYTLTNKAIAVLLSMVLLIGSASGIIEVVEEESITELTDITITPDTLERDGHDDDTPDTTEEPDADYLTDDYDIDGEQEYNASEYEKASPVDLQINLASLSEHHVFFYILGGQGALLASHNDGTEIDSLSVSGDFPYLIPDGDSITFRAQPAVGSRVKAWSGALLDANPDILTHTIPVTGDIEVYVEFEVAAYPVSYGIHDSSAPGGGVLTNPNQDGFVFTQGTDGIYRSTAPEFVRADQSLSFIATSNVGFLIGNWYVNNVTVQSGGNSFVSEARTGETDVRVSILEGKVVEFGVLPTDIGADVMTASYRLEGGSAMPLVYSGTTPPSAPEGANITFTAPEPPAGFTLYTYEWRVNGVLQPGENNRTFTYNEIHNNINVTVTLVRGVEVSFSANHGTVSAAYGASPGTPLSSGDIVREGTEITFTSTPPGGGFYVYEYVWSVNDVDLETQHHVDDAAVAGTFKYTPTLDINVIASLEQGYMVTFDASDGGGVTATVAVGTVDRPINSSSIQRAGSSITFRAIDPDDEDFEVSSYTWTISSGGSVTDTRSGHDLDEITFTPLNANIDVQLTFTPGFKVNFTAIGAPATGSITAAIFEGDSISNGAVVESGTTVVFTAAPSLSPTVYRVAQWTVGGVPQTTGLSQNNTVLTLAVNAVTDVSVSFEAVTLTLTPSTITILGNDMFYDIDVGGNAGGTITFDDDELPANVSVAQIGNTIRVSSSLLLTDADNTDPEKPLEVIVTREGVKTSLYIFIDLPYIRITPSTIRIDKDALEQKLTLETNAAGSIAIPSLAPFPTLSELPVPGVVYYSVKNIETNVFEITISAIRPTTGTLIVNQTMNVDKGLMHIPFTLNVNLTPPPQITSITPTTATVSAFERVRVHGTPPGAAPAVPPGPVEAVFNITGTNFTSDDGENQAEVVNSISLGTLPSWITSGAMVVNVTSATTAIVTVPLTVASNRTGDPNFNIAGREWLNGTLITTTLSNSSGVTGDLTISQVGPITLSPSSVTVTEANITTNPVAVTVTGSGVITDVRNNTGGGTFNANVLIEFATGADETTIFIRAVRPTAPPDITGSFTVTFTRDGIPATLTITVNIKSLDIPVVTWPTGFSATYGQALSQISTAGLTSGSAVFEETTVPGTFVWTEAITEPEARVGDAGVQSHSMTFIPDDTATYATVVTSGSELQVIDVAKATPTVTWPTGFAATYGQTIYQITYAGGSATFNNGESVPGSFTWNNSVNPVGNAGTQTHYLNFIPTSTANFNSVEDHPVSVTVNRADQAAPGAPSEDSKTAVSVTLLSIAGAEFGISSTTGVLPDSWQTGLTFTSLYPNTTYYFYARLPGNANQNPSSESPARLITTLKASLEGMPVITGNLIYGETLTAATGGLYASPPGDNQAGRDALGTLSYQWNRVGGSSAGPIPGATSATYTLGPNDVGEVITVTVSAANTEDPVTSLQTATIGRRQPVLSDLSYTLTPATFDGSPHSSTVNAASGVAGLGTITVYYRLIGTTDDWSDQPPVNAGNYQIRVSIEQGDNYLATIEPIVLTGTFSIAKATPVITDLSIGYLPTGSIPWNASFLTTPLTAIITPASEGLGAITILYSHNGDTPTTTPPGTPGTVNITVVIAEGTNFNAITTLDPIIIGTYTIVGIDVDPLNITAERFNTALGTAVDFDITVGSVTTFDGVTYQIRIKDSQISTVYFSTQAGGPWVSTIPEFRNATSGSVTVYFRVTRPDTTGYNPYFGSTTVTILPRQLTWDIGGGVTAATVGDKTFDGNNTATVIAAPSLSGLINGNTVTISTGSVTFSSVNAASGIPVNVSGWGITGDSNYTAPAAQPVFADANITPLQLTWSTGNTVNDKIYNGNNSATVANAPTLIGLLGGNTVAITTGSVTFSSLNAATGISINASGWGISGDSNYTAPAAQPAFAAANITPLQLTWSAGNTVSNKTYDGNNTATVDTAPTLVGLLGGNTVTIIPGTTVFNSINAAFGIPVSASGWSITGDSNYTAPAAQPMFAAADILPLQLVWSTGNTVNDKVFDAGTNATVQTAPTLVGVIGTDAVSVTTGTVAFNNMDAANGIGITALGWGIGGTAAGNYITPAVQPVFENANITARPITGMVGVTVSGLVDGRINAGTTLSADITSVIGVPDVTTISELDLDFQWYIYINGIPALIDSETDSTYVVRATDPVGANITVRVTGKANYADTLESNPVTVGLIPLGGTITIEGTPELYEVLTFNTESIVPETDSYSIIWLRDGTPIMGATGPFYTIEKNDVGKTLTVEISGTGDFTGSLRDSMLIPTTRPTAPLELTAIPGNSKVTLIWSEPYFDGGSAVTDYHVYILDEDGITWINVNVFTPFSTLLFTTSDNGLFTPFNTAPDTTLVINGLTNGTEYTFRVHAANDVGISDHIETTAIPVPPPVITSIVPATATIDLFSNIPEDGLVDDAVFDVTGTDLTAQAILNAGIFTISEFPAWILPSNLRVEYISPVKATVTVRLTIMPNTEAARSGNIGISNTITGAITGLLTISQDEAAPALVTYKVTILNSPNGAAVISGQSEAVRMFEPGDTVLLIAGTRDGFTFTNWSSSSQGIFLADTSADTTNFTMPSHDVIITANWTEDTQRSTYPEPPPGQPPGPPPRSPPEPIPAETLENNPGDVGNPEHTINPGADNGTGLGEDSASSGTSTPGTGNNTVPSGNPTSAGDAESGDGFGTWFKSNLWWIILLIGAVVATVTSLIIVLRKRKMNKAVIASSGDT